MHIITVLFTHIWLLSAAWTDFKYRKVSNRWCLFGFIVAMILVITRSISEGSGLAFFLGRIFGALFASGFLLLGALIRRGGIGTGDVKVFFVLGLLLGLEDVGIVLFLTLVISLMVAAFGLINRRISRRYALPLCTFAYFAVMCVCLFGEC